MTAKLHNNLTDVDVICRRGVMIPMRDGVRLACDIYLPGDTGQPAATKGTTGGTTGGATGGCAVLLERTPYGRDQPRRVLDAQFFAQHGYAVVMQDVRGRFDSEGLWRPLIDDPHDGFDTIAWLAAQPWCDGQVATMGASYAGTIQLSTATLNPPALRAMIVTTAAADAYRATLRHGGALELRWVCYIFNMAATSKEARADPALAQQLRAAAADLEPWLRHPPTQPGQTPLRALPTYEQWLIDVLGHTQRDTFWQQRCFAPLDYIAQYADVPTLHIGGWYDSYAGATCEAFNRLRAAKQARQCLIMGPWEHTALEDRVAGELDFGPQAVRLNNNLRLAWFDRYLKNQPTIADHWPDVQTFIMGGGSGRRTVLGHIDRGGSWLGTEQFPPGTVRHESYYLQPGGTLTPNAPEGNPPPSRFTFDPSQPVPTIGGCVSAAPTVLRPGGYDQRSQKSWFACDKDQPLADRPDVLCFITEPMNQPIKIVGPITVELFITSSVTDTDFTAKLVEVYPPTAQHPQGQAINLTDGILRARYRNSFQQPQPLTPGQVTPLTLHLFATACLVATGHRLRLDISSSNFPRFDINGNAGPAQQAIYHDPQHTSRLILPVI